MRPTRHSILIKVILYPLIVSLGQLSVINTAVASAEVKLATEIQKSLHQRGKPYLECAFAKMDRPYRVISVPWARAQLGTEHGAYDGFLWLQETISAIVMPLSQNRF